MANQKRGFQITLPPWHCHPRGGLPVSEHRQRKVKAGTSRRRFEERAARRLRRAARNSELMHSLLKRGALHSKTCRCAMRTCHNPVALSESIQDLLTLRFLQNVMERAVC